MSTYRGYRGFESYAGYEDVNKSYAVLYCSSTYKGYVAHTRLSSTYNPYAGYEDVDNPTLISSLFGSVQQYPPLYFNTED